MHDSFDSWYDAQYPALTGFGLWLRGGEPNILDPGEYLHRPARILIARLSTYHDVAESFTHRLLYRIAANIDGLYQ